MILRFLVDNHCGRGDLLAEHGLSVLIETPRGTLLFDGGAGRALLPNAATLGVDLSAVDAVIASHGHSDHTGGLVRLASLGSFPLYGHPALWGEKIAWQGGRRTFVGCQLSRHAVDFRPGEGVVELVEGLWAVTTSPDEREGALVPSTPRLLLRDEGETGPDPMADDLSLVLRGPGGYSVLLGCAHGGAANILEKVARTFGTRRFHSVSGGMHMAGQDRSFVDRVIGALATYEVSLWRPCHCTGLEALCAMERVLPDVRWAAAGTVLEL